MVDAAQELAQRMLADYAPDGKTFYTSDELPGTDERGPKRAISLWDVKAANYRTLEEVDDFGAFFPVSSPDGKTMVTAGHNSVLYLWEVGTGSECGN
jgi:WD40 repeat protein